MNPYEWQVHKFFSALMWRDNKGRGVVAADARKLKRECPPKTSLRAFMRQRAAKGDPIAKGWLQRKKIQLFAAAEAAE